MPALQSVAGQPVRNRKGKPWEGKAGEERGGSQKEDREEEQEAAAADLSEHSRASFGLGNPSVTAREAGDLP